MRLIDADAFRREIDNHWPFTKEEQSKHGIADIAKGTLLYVLNCMPTIDPDTDTISRQAAIDAINSYFGFDGEYGSAVQEVINGLPPAQPEILACGEGELIAQPEIIRCEDCKNSEHWYRDRRRCFLWSENGVSVFDDGYCNYAKRRTDE